MKHMYFYAVIVYLHLQDLLISIFCQTDFIQQKDKLVHIKKSHSCAQLKRHDRVTDVHRNKIKH